MSIAKTAKKGVTFYNPSKAYNGYTLFSTYNNDVWLIDMEGYFVNRWKMPYTPGAHQLLLPNGNLLFAGMFKSHKELGLPVEMAGVGGVLLEVDWESTLVWKNIVPLQNHDITPRGNGNILYPTYHPDGILPDEIADRLKGGLRNTEFNGRIWGDSIYEINREGEIIWKWRAFEHLDPEIDNLCDLENRVLWPYINSIYICNGQNLLVTLRAVSEVIKIDYKTGKVIGRYGKGKISHPHDGRELENGNIMVFDNGSHRHEYKPNYSRVVEICPDTDEIVWEYKSGLPSDFYSPVCGGCERMPNGNTVICDSWQGRIFEVTIEGELVWEFINPFVGSIVGMSTTMMWRAHRYPPEYLGLKGKNLSPSRSYWENYIYGPKSLNKDFKPSIF